MKYSIELSNKIVEWEKIKKDNFDDAIIDTINQFNFVIEMIKLGLTVYEDSISDYVVILLNSKHKHFNEIYDAYFKDKKLRTLFKNENHYYHLKLLRDDVKLTLEDAMRLEKDEILICTYNNFSKINDEKITTINKKLKEFKIIKTTTIETIDDEILETVLVPTDYDYVLTISNKTLLNMLRNLNNGYYFINVNNNEDINKLYYE